MRHGAGIAVVISVVNVAKPTTILRGMGDGLPGHVSSLTGFLFIKLNRATGGRAVS